MEPYFFVAIIIIVMMIGETFVRQKNVSITFNSDKIFSCKSVDLYTDLCLIIIMFVLLLIATFRNESVGSDYKTYIAMFRGLLNMDISDISGHYLLESGEFALPILGYFAQCFFTDEYELAVLLYIVVLGGFTYFIKRYSKDVLLSAYLFLTMSFYNMSLNILRQYLAAVLVLKAIEYISKDARKFFLLVVIAAGFHRTAILVVLLYIVMKLKWDIRLSCVFAFFVSVIFALFGNEVIPFLAQNSGYENYISSTENNSGIWIKVLINGTLFLAYFFSASTFAKKDINAKIWILGSAFAFGLSLFAINMHAINRLLLYFMLLEIVSIPNWFATMQNNNGCLIFKLLFIILSGVYYYILISFTSCYETVPYVTRNIF